MDNQDSAASVVRSDALLAGQLIEALAIVAHLSKEIREGESLVGWVKRMIRDRDYANDTINLIDRECSLCAPYKTLPDRVQNLISEREQEANAPADQTATAGKVRRDVGNSELEVTHGKG